MNVIVKSSNVVKFIQRCMEKVGTDTQHALLLARALVEGDLRGHYSHGLNRLDMYVRDVQLGTTQAKGTPSILKQTAATALVSGNDLLGPVVGDFCMKLAIEKARSAGIGWIVVRGSTHYGIAGFYSMMALEHNMIGMSMTNGSPILVPTRAKKCLVATNPLSVAAPTNTDDSFVLDMATSAVAVGKVEIAHREGRSIPRGWGVDSEGRETTDPGKVHPGGAVMPLGGGEETSGFKGYGLAVMVEMFSALLSGASWGQHVRPWMTNEKTANIGQCFVAIDLAAFDPNFKENLQALLDSCREMEPFDPSKPVLVAGDPERAHIKECEDQGGIPYHEKIVNHANELAKKLGVEPLT